MPGNSTYFISTDDEDDVLHVAGVAQFPFDFVHPRFKGFETRPKGDIIDEQNALSVGVELIPYLHIQQQIIRFDPRYVNAEVTKLYSTLFACLYSIN